MKTLTTLTAVAALIAGISIASAADSSSTNKTTAATSKSAMSTSAKIVGTAKFCVKGKSGALECKYASLSACQKEAKGQACSANPHTSTTGSK